VASRFSIETTLRLVDRMTAPVRRMTRNVERNISRMKRSADSLGRSLDTAAGRAGSAAKAVVGMTTAVGGGLAAAAKPGWEFEQAITDVGAAANKSRDQIADLEAKAKELGATTQFTATEAANAMEVLTRAGFDQEQVLGSVGPVLSGAAASGLEIAEMADHVANALKGMGLEVIDTETGLNNAAKVADVLALASARTNSTVGSLGESLKNVAGTASDLKIPLEDTVASVALLQDTGLDASVAGSALNTMLTKIAAGTGNVSKRARDADGNMKSFSELLAIVSDEAAKSGGDMDRVAYLADLVGLRGQKAASKLAKLFDEEKVQTLTRELEGASGKAQEMAEIRMSTTLGAWKLLESAVDAVRVKFFEGNKNLKPILENLRAWVDANGDLIASRLTEFLQELIRALPRILNMVVLLVKAFLFFKAAAVAVWLVQIAMKAATVAVWLYHAAAKAAAFMTSAYKVTMWALALSTGGATTALTAFGVVLGTIALPVTVIVVVVAALIAKLKELKQFLIGNGSVWELLGRLAGGEGSLADVSSRMKVEQEMKELNERSRSRGGGKAPEGAIDFAGLQGILSGGPMPAMAGVPQAGLPTSAELAAIQAQAQQEMAKAEVEVTINAPEGVVADAKPKTGKGSVKVRRTGGATSGAAR
jgi:TP901 family phage tail tape measure protein